MNDIEKAVETIRDKRAGRPRDSYNIGWTDACNAILRTLAAEKPCEKCANLKVCKIQKPDSSCRMWKAIIIPEKLCNGRGSIPIGSDLVPGFGIYRDCPGCSACQPTPDKPKAEPQQGEAGNPCICCGGKNGKHTSIWDRHLRESIPCRLEPEPQQGIPLTANLDAKQTQGLAEHVSKVAYGEPKDDVCKQCGCFVTSHGPVHLPGCSEDKKAEPQDEAGEFVQKVRNKLLDVALATGGVHKMAEPFQHLKKACAHIDRLTTKLASVTDGFSHTNETLAGAIEDNDRLTTELAEQKEANKSLAAIRMSLESREMAHLRTITQLRTALDEYGTHKTRCHHYSQPGVQSITTRPCTCGLEAALKGKD